MLVASAQQNLPAGWGIADCDPHITNPNNHCLLKLISKMHTTQQQQLLSQLNQQHGY